MVSNLTVNSQIIRVNNAEIDFGILRMTVIRMMLIIKHVYILDHY